MSDTARVWRKWTDEQIAKAVTCGTTTRQDQVKVLYNNRTHTAFVKWPGGRDGCPLFHSYVSPWVERYDLQSSRVNYGGGRIVWDSDRDADGRLTRNRLIQLVKDLDLDPEFVR